MVVSYHMGAGIRIWVLLKSSHCSYLLSHLSSTLKRHSLMSMARGFRGKLGDRVGQIIEYSGDLSGNHGRQHRLGRQVEDGL